jgi:hypothetical protein
MAPPVTIAVRPLRSSNSGNDSVFGTPTVALMHRTVPLGLAAAIRGWPSAKAADY